MPEFFLIHSGLKPIMFLSTEWETFEKLSYNVLAFLLSRDWACGCDNV